MIRRTLLPFLLLTALPTMAQDTVRVQLHGAVLDAVTHKPILEALVEWYDAGGKRQAITQTNSEGNYALFVLAGQPIELRVKENGYEPLVEQVPPFKPGESAREHELRLVPK